jgi:formylglycine-generating enzyme required for sulfatase activity
MRNGIVTALLLLIALVIIAAYYLRNRTQQTAGSSSGKSNSTLCRFSSDMGRDRALMVLIPAGDFFMGNPGGDERYYDENPCHRVYLDAFWIDCYEVTNRLYKQFIDETGHRVPYVEAAWAEPYNWGHKSYPPGKADFPVVLVSWEDAVAYAMWAGKRLPTEAEWEKAARGGLIKHAYPWGEKIDVQHANYFTSITAKNEIQPVGTFLPNPFGIYDMAGNVWEWCSDWYGKTYYRRSPDTNPPGPQEGLYRARKGRITLESSVYHFDRISVFWEKKLSFMPLLKMTFSSLNPTTVL